MVVLCSVNTTKYYLGELMSGHFTEVVFKTGLAVYATKLIDMSRCVDLECFCSSAGIIVYELSSACICCIESDVIVFSRKQFTRNNRITRFWDKVLSDNVSFHPRLAVYDNTLFKSQVKVCLAFGGFVLKKPLHTPCIFPVHLSHAYNQYLNCICLWGIM